MIVFHPYQPIMLYIKDLALPNDGRTIFLQNAWMLVNDTYKSDLPLLYPPHMIALAVIYFTAAMQEEMVMKSVDFGAWFARFNVDLNDVIYIFGCFLLICPVFVTQSKQVLVLVQQTLDLYQVMASYNEREVPDLLAKLKRFNT